MFSSTFGSSSSSVEKSASENFSRLAYDCMMDKYRQTKIPVSICPTGFESVCKVLEIIRDPQIPFLPNEYNGTIWKFNNNRFEDRHTSTNSISFKGFDELSDTVTKCKQKINGDSEISVSSNGTPAISIVNEMDIVQRWGYQFEGTCGESMVFKSSNGNKDVPYVSGFCYDYGENDQYQVCEIPTASGKYSFTIIMAKNGTQLSFDCINSATCNKNEKVKVTFPSFSTKTVTHFLTDIVKNAGIDYEYYQVENFIGKIQEFYQKSTFEVSERGFTGSSFTKALVALSFGGHKYMCFDKPFYWLVRDTSTRQIHFMGFYD